MWQHTSSPLFILTQYGLQDETFGIIYIPKLEVTLPLYLGANYENMANGAAVLGQTSVPIGGVNTNAVIAGHRGWNGYPYFLDLDELQIGDLVYIDNIWTLMKYEVVDIQVISPDDVDAIKIQEGARPCDSPDLPSAEHRRPAEAPRIL